jgi:hypothetical protein
MVAVKYRYLLTNCSTVGTKIKRIETAAIAEANICTDEALARCV